jgi:hypothetical protein
LVLRRYCKNITQTGAAGDPVQWTTICSGKQTWYCNGIETTPLKELLLLLPQNKLQPMISNQCERPTHAPASQICVPVANSSGAIKEAQLK